jgi:hypothetical protein
MPGDPDLDSLSGRTTHDASILEFDFVPQSDSIVFRYVFASEEYNEYVGSQYNDTFGFLINGKNCAVVKRADGGEDPVSINTINNGSHSDLYVDNTGGALNTEMDGLTTVLSCNASVTPNATNHAKLAIADATDFVLDSVVFIEAASFTAGITSISPNRGGTGGGVTVSVYGHGFLQADDPSIDDVSLILGGGAGPDITAGYAVVESDTSITGYFDLKQQALGMRDVRLAFPDGRSMLLPHAFEVIGTSGPLLAIDILGTAQPRLNRDTSYTMRVKNIGFNDAPAVTAGVWTSAQVLEG